MKYFFKNQSWYYIFSCLWLASSVHASGIRSEVPHVEAVDAAKNYWQGFDIYEQKKIVDGRDQYESSWRELKKGFERDKNVQIEAQIAKLKTAIKKYEEQIGKYPDSRTAHYAALNLAQVLNKLADYYDETSSQESVSYRRQALEHLESIQKNDPYFMENEAVLYNIALTYSLLGMEDKSLSSWEKLSQVGPKSQYGLFANVALGDHYFDTEEVADSIKYYKRALAIIEKSSIDNPEYERLRLQYRLVWAGYRSGNLDLAIESGVNLLVLSTLGTNKQQEIKIQKDAIEVVGDALYGKNDLEKTKKILRARSIISFAPAIGFRLMQNSLTRELLSDVIEIGEFVIDEYPVCKELPDVLTMLGTAYQKKSRDEKFVESYEKLALLLPERSLWRKRYAKEYQVVDEMAKKSAAAAKVLAGYFYEKGMKSSSEDAFKTSITYYQLLIKNFPNDQDSSEWRIKVAHAYYFAGEYEKSDNVYSDLKTKYKLSVVQLKVAAYQMALAREKIWRESFYRVANKGRSPIHDANVVQKLANLEQAVEEFVNRFPSEKINKEERYERVVDLLLVAAAAFRDQEQADKASRYWQRALVSQPTPVQRSIAIRGLVMAAMTGGTNDELVSVTQRFLKLEDLGSLGGGLKNELGGVLSTAIKEKSAKMMEEGDSLQAGESLVGVARDYAEIQDRETIYRDGAYLLAIGGDWAAAQKAADEYLNLGLTRKADDMLYLKARSQEYQMRFSDAANTYYKVATEYPSEKQRTLKALKSSEKLAAAEENWNLAAKAAAGVAVKAENPREKVKYYRKAVEYAQKSGNFTLAQQYVGAMSKSSKERQDKLEARLIAAKLDYESGNQQQAVGVYKEIANETLKRRSTLDDESYESLTGEANFLIAEDARASFEGFSVSKREGEITSNIKQKLTYFETLRKYYLESVKSGHKVFMPKSYYMLGSLADTFSDEIAALVYDKSLSLNDLQQQRVKEQAIRLRKIALNFHGRNIVLRSKNPTLYASNIWIKRSAQRMSSKEVPGGGKDGVAILPDDVGENLISEWSL